MSDSRLAISAKHAHKMQRFHMFKFQLEFPHVRSGLVPQSVLFGIGRGICWMERELVSHDTKSDNECETVSSCALLSEIASLVPRIRDQMFRTFGIVCKFAY
mgnify:CR=1 FL=1